MNIYWHIIFHPYLSIMLAFIYTLTKIRLITFWTLISFVLIFLSHLNVHSIHIKDVKEKRSLIIF